MANFKRVGYGIVEPNHLSAQRNGQIYAQLPAKSTITQIENGQFLKYDYASGEVNTTGAGEWLLAFDEIKNYPVDEQGLKYFCLKKENMVDGVITPRLFATHVGDTYTTNTIVGPNTSATAEFDSQVEIAKGDQLVINEDATQGAVGFLRPVGEEETPTGQIWQVVSDANYTVPDGLSAGLKLQRIQ